MLSHDSIYWLFPAGILLLPLLAFVVILFFGKYMERYNDKVSIIALLLAFGLSVALFAVNVQEHGANSQAHPIITSVSWMNLAGVDLQMGFLVDNLSAFMSMIVTGLGALVLIYSIFYMRGDTLYGRYFAYMCFFCFAMLGVVLSSNLLMTYVFWELVGLGSYFLIGFWFYKPPAAQDHHYQELKASYATGIDERYLSPAFAQKKAFVMNRVGDFGFGLGIVIFATVMLSAADLPGFKDMNLRDGPLNFDKLYAANLRGVFDVSSLLGLSGTALLTMAGIFIFMGAIGKSAQFPLHTWLPDAMQGPTTGSSIIHAATMVAAGVYLTARIHPLLTENALFFVAIIGGITAFLAATMALVQWDLKAVLAYSTISQLGFMMIGLGSNAYTAGLAHLFTHAIFKCMLFLCAGSVIVACHHLQDMNRMGGLRRKLPITHLATLCGTLAITGVPFFSGFYSKDAILAGALTNALLHHGAHWLPVILGIITAGLTAFYMFRLLFMTFYGESRDAHVYENAHESPAVATVPLLILATLCLGFWWSGYLSTSMWGSRPLPGVTLKARTFEAHGREVEQTMTTTGWVNALIVSPISPVATGNAPKAAELEHEEHIESLAHHVATYLSLLMLALGSGLAFVMYIGRAVSPEKLLQVPGLKLLYTIFSELWFFDRFYQNGIVPAFKALNRWTWRFDAVFIDGFLVDGWATVLKICRVIARAFDDWIVDKTVDAFGWATLFFGVLARATQAGKIQFYVCMTFGATMLLLLALLLY
ncbi:MAG: NADH-quinone oxidoreductase subunit L [Planctomycetota bacterium]